MRRIDRVTRVAGVAVAFVTMAATCARADFPSLSRPWAFGTPGGDGESGMRLGADASLADMSRSGTPNTADPRLGMLEPGGRLRATLARGPLDLTGDVILDTRWNVDSREYPQRLSLGLAGPPGSARVGIGFESGLYDGADLELESAALPLAPSHGRWAPAAVAWTRVRRLDTVETWLFTPAIGVASGAAHRDARGLGVMLSAQMDAAAGEHGSGFGMVAVRWVGGADETPQPSTSPLGTPVWATLSTRWFAHAAYAFPLERAQYARITVALGVGFDSPF